MFCVPRSHWNGFLECNCKEIAYSAIERRGSGDRTLQRADG
jgi:hypothetical protein